jgi:membrane-bound lytic murein transglycosylase B
LENVIKYDRKQPEFYEDTITYVSKRANILRAKKAKKLLKENLSLFVEVEEKFQVEKEILLALWGIETNFGKHVGKMDILSSLATLSFDKRRSDFFTSQLLTLLKLIDKKLIDPSKLYGSWAGAFGNFQFMPSTIKNYAIDYDNDNKIELKTSLKDSLASAANYINRIGWKKGEPCFYRVKLSKDIKNKYLNTSARKISNRKTVSKWKKKGIINFDNSELKTNYNSALVWPDANDGSPLYLVFSNYEKILKWNRSLRFGISVCTLAEMIKS